MTSEVFLYGFQSSLPPYRLDQDVINDWLILAHSRFETVSGGNLDERTKNILRRFCVAPQKISQRFYECPDIDENWNKHVIYQLMTEETFGADLDKRSHFFKKSSRRVFEDFYKEKDGPDHVIHVTCTGYVSPSPAQEFFSSWEAPPMLTHAYHMGCYASLPAVRMGMAFVQSSEIGHIVDVVHNEICSLHLNPSAHTPEQMVIQSLFGDGHIKYAISGRRTGSGLKVLKITEKLMPNSNEDMTWIPGPHGMKMTLSREVPSKIKLSVREFVEEMCRAVDIPFSQIQSEALFAVHPGGPKIIEGISEVFDLREDQIRSSFRVLRERGNMSSATLPHVWKDILEERPHQGTLVVSLAFGPGLTIFGGIFETVS